MDPEAKAAPIGPAWDGDLDWEALPRAEAQMLSLALVAEERSVTSGEDRCHPPAFLAELSPAHGVNAAINLVQPASLEPMPNGISCVADREQLRSRDHTMLRPNERPGGCGHLLQG